MEKKFAVAVAVILTSHLVGCSGPKVTPDMFSDTPSGIIIYAVKDLKDCPPPIKDVVCKTEVPFPYINIKGTYQYDFAAMFKQYKADIVAQQVEEKAVMTVTEISVTEDKGDSGIGMGMLKTALVLVPIPYAQSALIGLKGTSSKTTVLTDTGKLGYKVALSDGNNSPVQCEKNITNETCKATMIKALTTRK